MSKFEEILLGALKAAEFVAPIFVHNANSVAVLNASEDFTNQLVSAFAVKAAAPKS